MKPLRLVAVLAIVSILAVPLTASGAAPCAHAHNDYAHPRPLYDALKAGCCSVEADIHLVDGELLVAHDLEDAHPNRTLQNLYLDPLQNIVRQKPATPTPSAPLLLLIDIKSEAVSTYAVLTNVLAPYRAMLTRFTPRETVPGPVLIVLSGNRPTDIVSAQDMRWVGVDGRLPDLHETSPPHLIPLVSDRWTDHFTWRGPGPLPDAERNRLEEIVRLAHDQNRKLRFWATPDRPEVWRALQEAGVDLINTDDLDGLSRFLQNRPGSAPGNK